MKDDKIKSKSLEDGNEIEFYEKISEKFPFPDESDMTIGAEHSEEDYANQLVNDISQMVQKNSQYNIEGIVLEQPENNEKRVESINPTNINRHFQTFNEEKEVIKDVLTEYFKANLGHFVVKCNENSFQIFTDHIDQSFFEKISKLKCAYTIEQMEEKNCTQCLKIYVKITKIGE